MVLVKCCGLTRLEDAQLCMEAGADYLGVIRVEGTPRFQSLDFLKQVFDLCAKMEDTEVVAVYQDAPLDFIVQDVHQTQVSMVQLHGSESPQYIRELQQALKSPVSVWKVFDLFTPTSRKMLEAYAQEITGVLWDAPKSFKGNIDWQALAPQLTDAIEVADTLGFTTCLAGKLTAKNLPELMTRFWVDAVDVASGIENSETGFKDADKVKAFLDVARNRRLHPPH
jgi:phosphoribosylanthranilate isomerase